jgi:pimeloyl-ACP methyl ester carboxylesterase
MIDSDLPTAVAEALAAPTSGERISVEAAGIPWSALAWGDPSARPVLLIHGVTSSAATWWRVGPAIAASGRRVIAVDQAGHGRTGHWQGHHRFRDNAADIAAFMRAASLDRPDLQVIGHSWGAMTAAALPTAGIRPDTIVLIDPPAVPHAFMVQQVSASDEQVYDDIDDAILAVRAENPDWTDGDVHAKAEAPRCPRPWSRRGAAAPDAPGPPPAPGRRRGPGRNRG